MTHTVTSPGQDVKTASGKVRRRAAQGPSTGAGMKCSRGATGRAPAHSAGAQQELNKLMQGQGDVVAALSLGFAAAGTQSSRVPTVTGRSGYSSRATVNLLRSPREGLGRRKRRGHRRQGHCPKSPGHHRGINQFPGTGPLS